MKLQIKNFFEQKKMNGNYGEYTLQNGSAVFGGEDVFVVGIDIEDLSKYKGKTVVIGGKIEQGVYKDKPQIKLTKKTTIEIFEEKKEEPKVEDKKSGLYEEVNTDEKSYNNAKNCDYLVENYNYFIKCGIPPEVAGPWATSLLIQKFRK